MNKKREPSACRPKLNGNTPAGPGRRAVFVRRRLQRNVQVRLAQQERRCKSHPVGTLLPNPFGLFDMHGNLYEWCGDYFDEKWYAASPPNDPNGPSIGSGRVIRGGSWGNNAFASRSAYRDANSPSPRNPYYGFRCVITLDALATTAVTAKSTPPVAPPVAKPVVGPAPPLAVAPFDAAQAKAHQAAWAKHLGTQVETTNSVGAKMVLIPPGEFLMGSSDADIELALKIAEEDETRSRWRNRIQEERPQHRVRITQPFRLAAHESRSASSPYSSSKRSIRRRLKSLGAIQAQSSRKK